MWATGKRSVNVNSKGSDLCLTIISSGELLTLTVKSLCIWDDLN